MPQTTAVDGTNNRNRRANQVEVCGPEETRVLHLSESTSASRALQCVRALFGDRPVLLRMCCDYFFLNGGGPATHGNALKCNRGVGTGASPNTHSDVAPVGTMPSMLGVAIISSIDGLRERQSRSSSSRKGRRRRGRREERGGRTAEREGRREEGGAEEEGRRKEEGISYKPPHCARMSKERLPTQYPTQ